MLKIAIILGSPRPGRIGEAVAPWVHGIVKQRGDAEPCWTNASPGPAR